MYMIFGNKIIRSSTYNGIQKFTPSKKNSIIVILHENHAESKINKCYDAMYVKMWTTVLNVFQINQRA